ncbi:MAG: phosphoglycerate mutase family protein [Clostridia bacterium]|nr:phosphoglycerate mutase family protein [Clostridia bacterium]
MLNLTFIRHAETTLNKSGIFCGRTDCDVTLEGLRQAKNLQGKIVPRD